MRFVIDANILFAALIASEGSTRELLFSPALELISPSFVQEEIKKYRSFIAQKTGCEEKEIDQALHIILSRIKIIPFEKYAGYLEEAMNISPDQKDREYLALAIAFDCPLWSHDKELQQQMRVKILTTENIIRLLS